MIESLFLPLMLSLASQGAVASPSTPLIRASQASPSFNAEDRAALRCAAAFAIVTARTGKDAPEPELRARGQEFFIVTLAGLMDEYNLDRTQIESAVRAEVVALQKSDEADKIMPACLLMLQSAGL
ncbi:MAG: hypothetical protein AAF251_07260 [Pseudomonadota bacterium]